MLSPVSFEAVPTPPPQPSPGAFRSPTNTLGYDRYATHPRSPRHEPTSPRFDYTSPHRYEGVQSQRQIDSYSSRQMNGGYSPQRYDDLTLRSRAAQQPVRKEAPPVLNISAKSVSTPNITMNSHDDYSRGRIHDDYGRRRGHDDFSQSRGQEEELAIARYACSP